MNYTSKSALPKHASKKKIENGEMRKMSWLLQNQLGSSVNDSVLGCGLVAQPTILALHPTLNDALNRGVYAGMSRCLMPVVLVLLFCLR